MSPSTYYVVQFWASPRPDVDKYVCVPDTWLKWIDESKAIASVAYPGGNPGEIEELARNNRSNPNGWLACNASVEFATNSYEQAMEYLRALKKIKSFQTISIIPINEGGFSEDLPRQEPSKFRLTLPTSSSGGNHVNKEACKRPSLASPYARTPTGQTRPQEKMKSPAKTAERPRVSGSQNPVHDDRPSRSLQASLESRSTKVSQETSRSSPMHDVQAPRGVSHNCQRPGTSSNHACYSTKFDAVFGSMQAEIQKLTSEVKRWQRVTDQNVNKLMEIDAWMQADEMWKRTNASQLTQRSSMSEMPQNITNETISIQDNDDNNDDVNHGNLTGPSQVITPEESRLVLPPEYDRTNSEWTLRYRNPGPTLTELIPLSRVYVDSMKLKYCCVVARDCKALAQTLMVEVFTDRALKVCSLTGKRCPSSNSDSPVPPGLDENARNVIIRYAVKYGLERGWCIQDVQSIKSSMRDKLKICKRRVTRAMEKETKLISINNSRYL